MQSAYPDLSWLDSWSKIFSEIKVQLVYIHIGTCLLLLDIESFCSY